MSFKSLLMAACGILLTSSTGLAQSGILSPGQVWGNDTTSISPAVPTSGVLTNSARAASGADTIGTADCGRTLLLGTSTTSLTVPSTAGFTNQPNCAVKIITSDPGRGKSISGPGLSNLANESACTQQMGASGSSCILYPFQTIEMMIEGTTWAITKPASFLYASAGVTLTFNVDPANGSDTSDGLGTGSGAFQHIQYCVNFVANTVYFTSTVGAVSGLVGKAVCQLAHGTYNEAVNVKPLTGNFERNQSVASIVGDCSSQANMALVIIKGAGPGIGSVFSAFGVTTPWLIKCVNIAPTAPGDDAFFGDWHGNMDIGSFQITSQVGTVFHFRYTSHAEFLAGSTCLISPAASITSFATVTDKATVLGQGGPGSETCTVTGSPTLTSAYAFMADQSSMIDLGAITWTGTFTGPKAFINGGSSGASNPASYPASGAVTYNSPFVLAEMAPGTPGGVQCFLSSTVPSSTAAGVAGQFLESQGTGCPIWAVPSLQSYFTAFTADVALNNTGQFFDGPTVATGTTGTFFVSGSVTLLDTAGGAVFACKLWDGTNVYAVAESRTAGASNATSIALSGVSVSNPPANIKISCNDSTSTSGLIKASVFFANRDSTLYGMRIN